MLATAGTEMAEGPAVATLGGLEFMAMTEAQVIGRILRQVSLGEGGWLVNPNVDVLRVVSERPELRALLADADLVIADGMPLIWASRLQRTPLPERVPGSTLITSLTRDAGKAGVRVLLLGGRPGAGERAGRILRFGESQLEISSYCPPVGFEHDEAELAKLWDSFERFGPAICFCAFGFPKQELLIYDLHRRFPECWFIASGASIDFLAGDQRRAPQWMQRFGLEWAFRLVNEPRRLAGRYLWHDPPFALRLLITSLWRRVMMASSGEVRPSGRP
jgi:N-acetylglucosaminyldiphosphoundecaprenol N-acetyl-beta-D-mannosaminyltransferase